MPDFDMSQLSPQQLQALMDMGVLDEQGSQLEEQMQQAQALAQAPGRRYETPAGAALGGLGDILRTGSAHAQEKDLRQKQDELLGKKTKGRKTFADLMLAMQTGGMQANPGTTAPTDFSQPMGPVLGTGSYGQGPYGYKPGGY